MNKKSGEDLLLSAHGRKEHPYRMWESLHEAPDILQGCLADSVLDAAIKIADEIAQRDVQSIYFTGTGTSFFSGLFGTYAFAELAEFPTTNITAFEFMNYPPARLNDRCALVEISHSGGTQVGYDCAILAKERGAYVVGITDIAESRLGNVADSLLLGPGGKDTAIPKTRSFMAGLFRVLLMAAAIGERMNPGTWDRWIAELKRVPKLVDETLQLCDLLIPQAAESYLEIRNFYVVGAGPNWTTVQEGALKLLEAALVVSIGVEAEEAIHGPLAAVNEACAVALVATEGKGYERILRIAKAMRLLDIPIFAVGCPNGEIREHANHYIGVPDNLPEIVTPIVNIPALYLLSYWIAVNKGINPDILRSDDPIHHEAHLIMMPPGSH